MRAGLAAASAALLALPFAACELPFAASPPGDFAVELAARKGVLVSVRDSVVAVEADHRLVDVELAGSSGLEVRARLRVPVDPAPGDGRIGVVLLGGFDSGRSAVDVLPDTVDEIVAAADYPRSIADADDDSELAERYEELRAAAWDVPASLLLLADYLAGRPDVDPDRLALVGASLGGFFAPIAAAADTRFREVALLYAGGDLRAILDANLGADVPAAALRLGADLAVLPLQHLEPVRYMDRIRPRHVLIVNGLYDDRIPRRSAEALMRAARPPRDLVWLPSGHLDPDSTRLIEELVDTAFARLPLLGEGR